MRFFSLIGQNYSSREKKSSDSNFIPEKSQETNTVMAFKQKWEGLRKNKQKHKLSLVDFLAQTLNWSKANS